LATALVLSGTARGAADLTRDLIQDFKNVGFAYADSLSTLHVAGTPDKLLGLIAWGSMNTSIDKQSHSMDAARSGKRWNLITPLPSRATLRM
jgi:alkaline phosphatase